MSRLVLSDRPFDSIKPRVGDMRPQPLPWGKGALPGPTSVRASYLQCSRRGPVELPLSSPETWQGERGRSEGNRVGGGRAGS